MENNQFWIQFKIHKVFRPSAGFEDQVVCLIVSLVEGHAGVFRHHRHRGEDVVPPTLWKIHKQWNSESQETRCSDRMSGLPISELISYGISSVDHGLATAFLSVCKHKKGIKIVILISLKSGGFTVHSCAVGINGQMVSDWENSCECPGDIKTTSRTVRKCWCLSWRHDADTWRTKWTLGWW